MSKKSWLKSKFCTHYYGHFGGGDKPLTPAFFMRPRRTVLEGRKIREADTDYAAVVCQGCGWKFLETSKIIGTGFEYVQELNPPTHYNPYDPLQMQPPIFLKDKP